MSWDSDDCISVAYWAGGRLEVRGQSRLFAHMIPSDYCGMYSAQAIHSLDYERSQSHEKLSVIRALYLE